MKAEHCISVTSSINVRELRVLCSLSLAPRNEHMKKKTHGVMFDQRVTSSVCLSGIHSINNSDCSRNREKMCSFSQRWAEKKIVMFFLSIFILTSNGNIHIYYVCQENSVDIRVPQRIIRNDSADSRTCFLCHHNSIQTFTETNILFMTRYHRNWAGHCGCSWSSDDESLAQSEKKCPVVHKKTSVLDTFWAALLKNWS